ncbi:enoyl-CoA hydratase-related protein [Stutzerimonas stutzeri]|nr:enoyl-CoA hydratase-related protein [Stutzerimonas stutzeri]
MKNFSIQIDADGVALVTFDMAGKRLNVISDEVQTELEQLVSTLRDSPEIRGAVLVSGKENGFCAGADLGEIIGHFDRWRTAQRQDALRQGLAESSSLSRHLRALETCGKPVAAAISGMALGGGLELALACHYRVAVDDPKLRLAFPEAGVGLLPGAGGTQRLIRLIGIEAALPYLLDCRPIDPADALAGGLLHARVPAAELVETARRWVLENPQAVAPWDQKEFRLPGGGPHTPQGYRGFGPAIAARLAGGSADQPAQANILKCVYEGAQVPIDAGLRIESRYFFNTVRSPQAKVMARTFFVSRQTLAKREKHTDPRSYLDALRQATKTEQQVLLEEGVAAPLVAALARRYAVEGAAIEAPSQTQCEDTDFANIAAIKQRLLYAQTLAAVRALEGGNAGDALEADASAVAAGFPSWTGGPISFIDVEGPQRFLAQAERFVAELGERFAVPAGLRERAAAGRGLYDEPA